METISIRASEGNKMEHNVRLCDTVCLMLPMNAKTVVTKLDAVVRALNGRRAAEDISISL
jgi:hypothetical protein